MTRFHEVFEQSKPVVAMIHLLPLPGTPKYRGSVTEIVERALREAKLYVKAGVDALAIENMHDVPYLRNHVGPEIVSIMSVIGHEVKRSSRLPCGVQVLAGANAEALAVAKATGLNFVRVEGFVFSHVADEGLIDSCAGELLRYRKQIDAEEVLIFTDIKKKHSSHALTGDIDIAETARAAEFFLSDGVIVTGESTGREAEREEIEAVKEAVAIPVIVGSGVTIDNVGEYMRGCDALIVGSCFKEQGYWGNEIDYDRTCAFMEKVRTERKGLSRA